MDQIYQMKTNKNWDEKAYAILGYEMILWNITTHNPTCNPMPNVFHNHRSKFHLINELIYVYTIVTDYWVTTSFWYYR